MQNKLEKLRSSFRFTRRTFAYPYIVFLMLFVVVPLVLILVNAFLVNGKLSFGNFIAFSKEQSSLLILGNSLLVGVITTVFCLIIGYPVAYILSKNKMSKMFVLLFVLPMWVNFLIRTLATKEIFRTVGIPLGMGTVIFGMIYNYLPFMILPLHTTLSGIDKSYEEAAKDLGADPVTTFLKTTLPLSLPGILSGITMVFIPTISTFAISQILSERTVYLFGDDIDNKFANGLYGVGSVMSLVMIAFVLLSNFFLRKVNKTAEGGRTLW